jgi:hypothetical protein
MLDSVSNLMFSERRGNKRRHTDYTLTIMESSAGRVRGVSSDVLKIRLPFIKIFRNSRRSSYRYFLGDFGVQATPIRLTRPNVYVCLIGCLSPATCI